MEFDHRRRYGSTGGAATHNAPTPGKQTLTQGMVQMHPAMAPSSAPAEPAIAPPPLPVPAGPRPTLQMLFGRRDSASDPEQVHAVAARGTATAATQLPHLAQIQKSFGRHDVSGVQAHVGAEATASAQAMGAAAYATGNHVVLGAGTDLHTVAHEAAHVVQQRGGVQLKGGVGEVGDAYERQADEVADRVVRGESAEALLDRYAGGEAAPASAVQRVTLLDLNPGQYSTYVKFERWVKNHKVIHALRVEEMLEHAPTFDDFQTFMEGVEDELKYPSLSFNEKTFCTSTEQEYFAKYPTPVQITTSIWGGMPTTTLTTTPSIPPPVNNNNNPQQTEELDRPSNPMAKFRVLPSAMKHFKHLKKKESELPKNQDDLQNYVSIGRDAFGNVGPHWSMQLDSVWTHQGYGNYELQPWTILISRGDKPQTWVVFHYGPTGTEID